MSIALLVLGTDAQSSTTTGVGDYIRLGLGASDAADSGPSTSLASTISYANTSFSYAPLTTAEASSTATSPPTNATWTWPWTTAGCVNTTIPDQRTEGIYQYGFIPTNVFCPPNNTACLSVASAQAKTCSPQWDAYYSASSAFIASRLSDANAPLTTSILTATETITTTSFTSTSTAKEVETNRQGEYTPVYVFGDGAESVYLSTYYMTFTKHVGTFTPAKPCCAVTAASTVACEYCMINGGEVQLLYWPDSGNNTYNGTYNNATTGPITGAPATVTTLGLTLTSPSVYISFQTIFATDNCGAVGRNHTGSVIAMRPQDVSTVVGFPGYEYEPINYNNLHLTASVLPLSIYEDQCIELCETIKVDHYKPYLSVPQQIRNLDPAWNTCQLNWYGVYDPPIALTPAASVKGPLAPTVSESVAVQTTESARPCSIPAHVTPTSTARPSAVPDTEIDGPTATTPAQTNHAQTNTRASDGTPTSVPPPVETIAPFSSQDTPPTPQSEHSQEPTPNSESFHEPTMTGLTSNDQSTHADPTGPAPTHAPSKQSQEDSESPASHTTTNALSILQQAESSFSAAIRTGGPAETVTAASADPGADSPVVTGDAVVSYFSGQSISASPVLATPEPSLSPADPSQASSTSHAATGDMPSQYVVDGQTLAPGSSPVVVSGTTYSLDPSASHVVVNGVTDPGVPPAGPTHFPVNSVGDSTIIWESASQFKVGSQTLAPGSSAMTIGGSTYSLAPSGSTIVVNGQTQAIGQQQQTGTQAVTGATNPTADPAAAPVINVGSLQYTAAALGTGSVSGFVINGQTLTNGGAITIGSGVSAETVRMTASDVKTEVLYGTMSTTILGEPPAATASASGSSASEASSTDGTTIAAAGSSSIGGNTVSALPGSQAGRSWHCDIGTLLWVLLLNGLAMT